MCYSVTTLIGFPSIPNTSINYPPQSPTVGCLCLNPDYLLFCSHIVHIWNKNEKFGGIRCIELLIFGGRWRGEINLRPTVNSIAPRKDISLYTFLVVCILSAQVYSDLFYTASRMFMLFVSN